MNQADTSTLLARVREGNSDAFTILFGRYRSRALAWAEYRINPRFRRRIDAEDIVQQAFLKAHELIRDTDLKSRRPFVAWVLALTENIVRDEVRKHLAGMRTVEREDPLTDGSLGRVSVDDSTPSQKFSKRQLRDELMEILSELSELQRAAIMHVRIGGQKVEKAAHELGVTPRQVSLALAQGYARIGKLVENRPTRCPYLHEQYSSLRENESRLNSSRARGSTQTG